VEIATWQCPSDPLSVSPVIVGDPADDRVRGYAAELLAAGAPQPIVLDYRAWLADPERAAASVPVGAHVRLESPGCHPSTYCALLARGAAAAEAEGAPRVSARRARSLRLTHGALGWPRQWFLGLADLLRGMRSALAERAARPSIDPAAVILAFDKERARRLLAGGGLPVPPSPGGIGGFGELEQRMERMPRVFVKLAHGSAASGVVAVARSRQGIRAWTTVEVTRGRDGVALFNTRRIRRLGSAAEVADVIDALAPHGVVVEGWVPKAGHGRRCFDLRVVAIAGRSRHAVVRWSETPITNLHLGCERSGADGLRAAMGEARWAALTGSVEQVAARFGRPLHLGLDIAITPGRRHVILEVNAFGDFIRGALDRGQTPHRAEVEALVRGPEPTAAPSCRPC
jgi:hypothetical protein